MNLIEINKKLPDNVCVQVFDITEFPTLLLKLSDFWTGIITPKQGEDEKIKWVMPYLKYNINEEVRYLIWFFDNNENHTITDEDKVLKEVKQFLEDEKELENENSGNI